MHWGAGRECRYSGSRGIGGISELLGVSGGIKGLGAIRGALGPGRECRYPWASRV